MIICEEMKKLRGALDKMGVEWVDASEEWEKNFYICRTHFSYNNKRYSVINGFGSFGGYYKFREDNKNLLEIMLPNNEIEGYLTAGDVLNLIKGGL